MQSLIKIIRLKLAGVTNRPSQFVLKSTLLKLDDQARLKRVDDSAQIIHAPANCAVGHAGEPW
jgi:hypothetical protein